MGNEPGELMHFVHISDSHISSFESERTEAFNRFCSETIKRVNPSFVLHTGDLTDGKGSKGDWTQQEIDWKTYRKTLEDNGLFDRSFWVDIRGNHDSYGAPLWNSPLNLYNQYAVYGKDSNSPFSMQNLTSSAVYSVSGTNDTAVIEFNYQSPSGKSKFTFLSIDLIPETAFSALADLFGYVHPDRAEILLQRLKNAEGNSNQTIVLGHYPIGSIPIRERVFEGKSATIGSISQQSPFLAFLCGHVHQTNYYNMQKQGFHELELADFKIHRYYRVFAYDHSIYSFIDAEMDQNPVILITNPKDSRFISEREPLHRIATSTHIRALIITQAGSVINAEVFIDGKSLGKMSYSGSGHLYTLPWNPQDYPKGTHNIVIQVTGTVSRKISQPFSIDGTVAGLWEPISPLNNFSQVSLGDAIWGISVATLLFVLTLFLLIPKIFRLIMNRTGRWDSFEERMLEKYEWEDHISQNMREGIPAPGNLFTWQIEEILFEYSRIQFLPWLFLTAATFWMFTFPIFIGPLDNNKTWGVIFSHSTLINGQNWTNYETGFVILLYDILMLIPCMVLAAKAARRSHFMEFSKINGGNPPDVSSWHFILPGLPFRKKGFHNCRHNYILKSKGTFGLVFLQLLGFVLMVTYTCLAFGPGSLFCSPVFWIWVCSFIMVGLLIWTEVKRVRQNEISSMGDEDSLSVVSKK
eukprot:TRINITY_DN2276_c3_g1_i1.p1 TRINITY_DN2276_c3_g1~~TRINITY_DN2276_c3_g1_i1.p1  ORF type:complete len:693 (+),score=230.69 TRINITY_DN2276_c3_g1_i1:536-2614(+)